MPITNVSNFNDTNHMSDSELDTLVLSIMSSLKTTHDSYNQASQTYGFFFFEGESPVFKQKLCAALAAQYEKFGNEFWKQAGAV